MTGSKSKVESHDALASFEIVYHSAGFVPIDHRPPPRRTSCSSCQEKSPLLIGPRPPLLQMIQLRFFDQPLALQSPEDNAGGDVKLASVPFDVSRSEAARLSNAIKSCRRNELTCGETVCGYFLRIASRSGDD